MKEDAIITNISGSSRLPFCVVRRAKRLYPISCECLMKFASPPDSPPDTRHTPGGWSYPICITRHKLLDSRSHIMAWRGHVSSIRVTNARAVSYLRAPARNWLWDGIRHWNTKGATVPRWSFCVCYTHPRFKGFGGFPCKRVVEMRQIKY